MINPRPDGAPVKPGPVAPDIEALLHIIAQGRGMSFLPAAACRLYPRPGIAYIEVTDAPQSTAALAWLPGNRNRPALAALRDAARIALRGPAPRRATQS
ncbi:LysR substrate-binding domain-containing protein [Streptomyces sp. 8N706]|uniref:LysR substrate-binding domain-containing protein n=1 Tax=Streptomyces sp. 8N706 TaxID=3457416 RepID=UPI003FD20E9A